MTMVLMVRAGEGDGMRERYNRVSHVVCIYIVCFSLKSRLLYFTAWEEPDSVLYNLGGAGFCTLPIGRSRLLYFADGEELAPAHCRSGGAAWLMCFTDWEEPAHALHRWGGAGSCMLPGVWG